MFGTQNLTKTTLENHRDDKKKPENGKTTKKTLVWAPKKGPTGITGIHRNQPPPPDPPGPPRPPPPRPRNAKQVS